MATHDEGQRYDKEALIDQYEEALFRLAFLQRAQDEVQELQQKLDSGALGISDEEIEEAFQKNKGRTLRAIDGALRQRRRKRFVRHTLPRAGQIAASLLLAFFITATAALAVSPEVRARALKFIINVQQEYAELSLVQDDAAAFYVPAGWTGEYFLSYIPAGFEMGGMQGDDSELADVYYTNAQGKVLVFSDMSENTSSNIDTEDAQIESVMIQGRSGIISEKEGNVKIAWAVDDRYFIVDYDGDRETALLIAEGVRKII